MLYSSIFKIIFALFISLLSVSACSKANEELAGTSSKISGQPAAIPADVIARVGDEEISFSMLNTMLNSSAIVGLSIPALGTPERSKVMITLLDKVISANLLYLDAKKKGTDRQTAYTTDMKQYEDNVLVTMYKSNVLIGDIPVSEQEVLDFYNSSISPETA